MAASPVLPFALQAVTVAVAFAGLARVLRMRRLADDPRLTALATFFGLFGAAAAVDLAGSSLLRVALRRGTIARESFDHLDVVFWLGHALLLASLVAAAAAFRPPASAEGSGARASAIAAVLVVAEPVLRAVETAALLYLVVRTALNHRARRNLGSLRVAVGFFLLMAAHATFLGDPHPLGPRPLLGVALALAGTVALVASLPPRRRA